MNFIRRKDPRFPLPLLFIGSLLLVSFFLVVRDVRAVCTTPVDDLNVTANTTLCTGTYTLTDAGSEGVIRITASNVTLDCEANTIIRSGGDGSTGFGIRVNQDAGLSNVTIQNCRIENYGQDILAGNTSNLTIKNNTLTINHTNGKGLQMSANNVDIDTILVSGNTISGTGNAMSFSPTNTATNVTIQNNTFSASIDNLLINANSDTSTRVTVSGNTFTIGSGEVINLTTLTNGVAQNNTIQSAVTGNFLIQNSPGVTVENNTIQTLQLENADNGTFQKNIINAATISAFSGNGSTGNVFQNNIIKTTGNFALRFADSGSNTIRNNTIYGGVNNALWLENTSTSNTFTNNIISYFGDGANAFSVSSGSTTGFSSNYNLFYGTNASFNASWSGSAISSFASWKSTTSQDANSVSGDPLYTNASSNDFTLQVTSPAIDAGNPTSSAPTTDYAGSTRPYGSTGRYDAGAYETSTPVTTNVSLAATPSYSESTGHTVSLAITDTSSNPTGTKYAIYESATARWLQGDGTGGTTPVYSTTKSWTHTNLSANTAYSYDVRTANSGETTITALKGSPVSTTSTLAAPTNLAASNVTTSSLTLSWTAPSGTITSYDISYGTTSAANTTVLTGVTTTSRVIASLSAGTTYFFKVRANSAAGAGPYSSTLSQATSQETPTETPEEEETPTEETPDEDEEQPINDTPEEDAPEIEEPAEPTPTEDEPEPETETPTSHELLLMPDTTANGNIRVVNGEGIQRLSFFAFGGQILMHAITADLRGDGEPEIIVSEMTDDAPPHLRVFSHDGDLLADIFPYPQKHNINGGAFIAAGDVNGDGADELAVIPFDNRSHLLVYSFRQSFNDPRVIAQVMVYDTGFRDGAHIQSGDVTGDSRDDLVIWTNDRRPNVQVYSFQNGALVQEAFVFPYPHPLPNGANIALADLDGDGAKEIAIVPNGHGSANIQIYTFAFDERTRVANGRALQRLTWTIGYEPETHGAFDIAAGDINGDGDDELVISAKKGRGGHVQTFDYWHGSHTLDPIHEFFPYDSSYFGGVYVHLADVDEDGRDELVTSTQDGSSPNTRVYRLSTRKYTRWELDSWFWAFDKRALIGTRVSH